MLAENFDILLTFDRNLEHQQNFEKISDNGFVLIAEQYLSNFCVNPVTNVKIELEKNLKTGAIKLGNKKKTEEWIYLPPSSCRIPLTAIWLYQPSIWASFVYWIFLDSQ